MAVNPLDLQTNFMQINSISKREVLSKEQEILKQEYVTDLLKKESEKNTENVRELKEIPGGRMRGRPCHGGELHP